VQGRAKQFTTERYRTHMQLLGESADLFEQAPGERGMVMICFTMKSLDVVFKVIRDRIPEPKTITPQGVVKQYNFVFRHDRAGRLVDAQEFRRLRIPAQRFALALLDVLLQEAGSSVRRDGDDLVFAQVYVERRLTPLNLYLREPPECGRVLLDYGQALKDRPHQPVRRRPVQELGVTRNSRVIFYDYGEVTVDRRVFHELPVPPIGRRDARQPGSTSVSDVFPERSEPAAGQRQCGRVARHNDLFSPASGARRRRIRAGGRSSIAL
jgi:isocitrate dehydrogenase kinase/phosphatase